MYGQLKMILVVLVATIVIKKSHCCCCPCGLFGYVCCGCNLFGCNCDYKGSEYCHYHANMDSAHGKCLQSSEMACDRMFYKLGNNIAATNDPREIFRKLDRNKDGYIRKNEFEMASTYLDQFYSNGSNATLIFNELDLNKNGFIEPTEIDSTLVQGWDENSNSMRPY